MMINTKMMLDMRKLFDQVGRLLLTYCFLSSFSYSDLFPIVIMDMVIVIKVWIKIMIMINIQPRYDVRHVKLNQVSLLLLTYCHYNIFGILSVLIIAGVNKVALI